MSTNAQRFRTTGWERARVAHERVKPDFAAHMRRIARPAQIAFQRLMVSYGGEPVGIECRKGDHTQWAFAIPEMSDSGQPWRVQYFDADGFIGHGAYASLTLAIESMIQDGYRTADPGALDRIGATDRWALGVKRATIRQRFQEGQITFNQMIDAINTLLL